MFDFHQISIFLNSSTILIVKWVIFFWFEPLITSTSSEPLKVLKNLEHSFIRISLLELSYLYHCIFNIFLIEQQDQPEVSNLLGVARECLPDTLCFRAFSFLLLLITEQSAGLLVFLSGDLSHSYRTATLFQVQFSTAKKMQPFILRLSLYSLK